MSWYSVKKQVMEVSFFFYPTIIFPKKLTIQKNNVL
jgi:hypothetical protein